MFCNFSFHPRSKYFICITKVKVYNWSNIISTQVIVVRVENTEVLKSTNPFKGMKKGMKK